MVAGWGISDKYSALQGGLTARSVGLFAHRGRVDGFSVNTGPYPGTTDPDATPFGESEDTSLREGAHVVAVCIWRGFDPVVEPDHNSGLDAVFRAARRMMSDR